MYRLILAAAAAGFALLAVADANAADQYPARTRAEMNKLFYTIAQPNNWTGFYAGINGGYSSGQDLPGFTGGGQLGYKLQIHPNLGVGVIIDRKQSLQA